MLYRFYLDGNLLADEPTGWKELVDSIKHYSELRGILITQDVTLGFIGDGYDYLRGIFDSDQVCALSELRIEYNCSGSFEEVFSGIIFITSISFEDNICKTKVEDNSFFAKINNNKSIKAFCSAGRSKNGVAIDPAIVDAVHMFDPCTCNAAFDRRAHRIVDCFRFIIHFMTDGQVNFVSDAFGTGGEWEGHLITTGWALRDPLETDVKTFPFFSFKEIFSEVNKKYNIGMSVETIAGVPTVRIEPFTYFRTQTPSVTLTNPSGIKVSTDISELYAKVVIGSDKTEKTDSCSVGGSANFPENVDFVGFKQEEFPLLTECNIDTELNLVSSWIISSNVIQRVTFAGNDNYDEDIVFIEAEFNGDAVQTDVFNDGNCYYNFFYTNVEVLQRWNSALPNIVQVILGSGNNLFEAYTTVTNSITLTTASPSYASATLDGFGNALELFDDDFNTGFDGGVPSPNNYGATVNPVVQVPQGTPVGPTESLYIVPVNGNYQFSAFSNLQFPNGPGAVGATQNVKITISHYDSTGILLNFWDFSDTFILTTNPQTYLLSVSSGIIGATAGDYFSVTYLFSIVSPPSTNRVVVIKLPGNDLLTRGTGFLCIFNQGYGGQLVRVSNADFANILFEFEYPLSFAQSKAIKADTKKPIQFNWCDKNYNAYIHDIKYNHHKNSKLILKTSKNGFRNNP